MKKHIIIIRDAGKTLIKISEEVTHEDALLMIAKLLEELRIKHIRESL